MFLKVKMQVLSWARLLTEASALGEPAWKDAGTKPGLQIWRIVVGMTHATWCGITCWTSAGVLKFYFLWLSLSYSIKYNVKSRTQNGVSNTPCWLLQKFIVTEWPREDYGKFFNGDSYIILNVSIASVLHTLITTACIFTIFNSQCGLKKIRFSL